MDWKAKWIWDDSGEHPRNYWACFRRAFRLEDVFDDATLNITADTRYIVSVNGAEVGRGPVRGWPFELSYDSYALKDILHQGENIIAVLVTHYGISTCQYIEGRGGIIAQLDVTSGGNNILNLVTDDSWKTTVHSGYERSAVRIGNCLPWTEIYNAEKLDDNWVSLNFSDDEWVHAQIIGDVGIEPWTKLVPRDIPFLTEEVLYPRRVISLNEVKPVTQHVSVDLRPNMFPGEYDVNSNKNFLGYLISLLQSPRHMEGYISLSYNAHGSFKCWFKLNQITYDISNGDRVKVSLEEGINFLMINASGRHHDPTVHLTFDFEEGVCFNAPIIEGDYEFITLGPFNKKTTVEIGYQTDSTLKETDEYKKASNIKDADSLEAYRAWIKPVIREHTCIDNVTSMSVYQKVIKSYDVTADLQNMVIANSSCTYVKPFASGDTEVLIDFGRELSGFLELDVDAPAGVIFDFHMFESLHDDVIEYNFTLNNTLRYITKQGRQTYRSLIRRGFRYVAVTIRNFNAPVKVYSFKTYLSTYPVAEIGQFQCSDYKLNRIWEISRDTTRLCMEDTFVDCPAYEQTFWVGDSRTESLINYYTFGAYDIVKRSLKLVPKSMYRSPLPESHVPSGWQNVIPAWSLCWITACKEYFEYTGDTRLVREVYESLIQTVKGFESFINKEGLLEISAWNMLDWAPMDIADNNGVVTHQNALLVRAIRDTMHISSLLGKHEDIKWLERLAEMIANAINKYLWSEVNEAFIDSIHSNGERSDVISLQTNLMIYLSGCVNGERKKSIEKHLLNPPKHFVKIASPFINFFYYEALIKLDKLDAVLQDIKDVWGYMLDHDATTCWEGWQMVEGHYTRSHCHAWSAAPGYFLGAYVLGVRPLTPGFDKMQIEPRLCGLKWVKGVVPVPQGMVEVSVIDNEEVLDVRVKIPQKTRASIVLPRQNKRIRLNGNFIHDHIIEI